MRNGALKRPTGCATSGGGGQVVLCWGSCFGESNGYIFDPNLIRCFLQLSVPRAWATELAELDESTSHAAFGSTTYVRYWLANKSHMTSPTLYGSLNAFRLMLQRYQNLLYQPSEGPVMWQHNTLQLPLWVICCLLVHVHTYVCTMDVGGCD